MINLNDLKVPNSYAESYFSFVPILYSENMQIFGYFQSEKYFKESEEFVRTCFAPKNEILEYIVSKYGSVIEENTASIHVRRGDYLTNGGGFCILDHMYYDGAIKHMIKNGIEKFLVCSDDIAWCKNAFRDRCFQMVNREKD